MQQNATKRNGTPHKPSVEQLNAIDLLVSGQSDRETAEAVGVHRTTVTRWRLYDPWFQAELNRRRADLFAAAAERLRALLPKALEALEAELVGGENRMAAIGLVLKLARLTDAPLPSGPFDADEIIAQRVAQKLDAMDAERAKFTTEDGVPFDEIIPPCYDDIKRREAQAVRQTLDEIERRLRADPE